MLNENKDGRKGYRERYVAFIDILGFSKLVEKSEIDYYLFQTLRKILSTEYSTRNHSGPDATRLYQFSDSIVISARNDENGLKDIIYDIAEICDRLLRYYILTRGGITKGKLCEDDNALFGPGLIRAYYIEDKIAVYPRIIIDSRIFNEVKKISFHTSHFCRGFDALYHLDILKLCPYFYGNLDPVMVSRKKGIGVFHTKDEWLQAFKENIEEELDNQKDNISIVRKYVWMAKYFNSFLRKSNNANITAIKSHLLRELL